MDLKVLHVDQVQRTKPKLSKKLVIFLSLCALASATATLYILFFTGPGTFQAPNFFAPKKPAVALKTGYNNPFDKETQYVNPFDTFKSPFYSLRKEEAAKK